MALLKAFKSIRPVPELVDKIAALPYDVMNSEEARKMVAGNIYSFLHVDRPEVDLDASINVYDKMVYEKARDNLQIMIDNGWLKKDNKECFYIYKLIMDSHEQTGIVCCLSVDDYNNNVIKKHEHTRRDKEQDRINHVKYCNANTGPIFLMYKAQEQITAIINKFTSENTSIYNFTSENNIKHLFWVIEDEEVINNITGLFKDINSIYIADGHHRAAAAVEVARLKKEEKENYYTGDEEFNFFLGVLFPHNELMVMDYNRVVRNLNNLTESEFLNLIKEKFIVEEFKGEGQFKPVKKHNFSLYLRDKWYKIIPIVDSFNENDLIDSLDVSILQNNIFSPILEIEDPRTDKRIDFVGGIRGSVEIERLVGKGMAAGFALYPTDVEDLMKIADINKVMPPKSTWFEPKLRSGLFIHDLEN